MGTLIAAGVAVAAGGGAYEPVLTATLVLAVLVGLATAIL